MKFDIKNISLKDVADGNSDIIATNEESFTIAKLILEQKVRDAISDSKEINDTKKEITALIDNWIEDGIVSVTMYDVMNKFTFNEYNKLNFITHHNSVALVESVLHASGKEIPEDKRAMLLENGNIAMFIKNNADALGENFVKKYGF